MSTENAVGAKEESNAAVEVNSTGNDSLLEQTSEKRGGEKFVGALDCKVRELDSSSEKEANNLSTTVDKKAETPTNLFYKKNGEPAASFDSNMGSDSAIHSRKGDDVYGPLQKNSGDLTGSAQGLSSSLSNSFDKRTSDHSNLVIDSRVPTVPSTSSKLTLETVSAKTPNNNQPNLETDMLAAHGYNGAVPSIPSISSVSVNAPGASGVTGALSTHGYSGAVPSIPSIPSVSVNAPGASGVTGALSTHGYSGAVPSISINASAESSTVSAEMQAKTSSVTRETGDLLETANQSRAAFGAPAQLGKYSAGIMKRYCTVLYPVKCEVLCLLSSRRCLTL